MGIIIKNVSYKYGLSKTNAINKISLDIEDNGIYGLLGHSGSGKTTLLELIAGLIEPNTGKIEIDELTYDKDKKDIRKKLGFLFQAVDSQMFNKTVKKELEFGAEIFNLKKNKVLDALNLVELSSEYLNMNIEELSLGEKKLIAIASILVYNPKIILLDEPVTGLDFKNRNKIIRLIKILKNEYHKIIIIASNDVDLLYELCDDVIILDNGELLLYGDPDSVYSQKHIIEEYNITLPKIIKFERTVKEKKDIKLMHTNSINDLIKEVYRNV